MTQKNVTKLRKMQKKSTNVAGLRNIEKDNFRAEVLGERCGK
jgi:hypothetical protein